MIINKISLPNSVPKVIKCVHFGISQQPKQNFASSDCFINTGAVKTATSLSKPSSTEALLQKKIKEISDLDAKFTNAILCGNLEEARIIENLKDVAFSDISLKKMKEIKDYLKKNPQIAKLEKLLENNESYQSFLKKYKSRKIELSKALYGVVTTKGEIYKNLPEYYYVNSSLSNKTTIKPYTFISLLKSIDKPKGSGVYAIQEILKKSLNDPSTRGRIILNAGSIDGKTSPHGFYYKMGFRSTNQKLNQALEYWFQSGGKREDLCQKVIMNLLESGENLQQYNLLPNTIMYLPKENIKHCLEYKIE